MVGGEAKKKATHSIAGRPLETRSKRNTGCRWQNSPGFPLAEAILSGIDGDGAVGIKRIKEVGGLTAAQKPEEAQHDGMPRSAIETGMVDWVLPVAEMPRRLLENLRQRDCY